MTRTTLSLLFLGCTLVATPAVAGPYSDDLAKCLVKSTTDSDKTLLMKWMFAGASLHPEVKDIGTVTDAQRDALNRSTASMVQRLLTVSCRQPFQDAVKYEGPAVLQSSFQVLGQVAGTGLFSHPSVAGFMGEFTKYLDKAAFDAVMQPAK
jgi:hypothetical protein